jgi:hemerythrin
MSQNYVPYGSQQLPLSHGAGFALPWMEQLTLQSEELNQEHQAVLQKLNDLVLALRFGDPTRVTMACCALSAEAKEHFATEKEMMLAVDYPDSAAHIEQHEDLLRGIGRIQFAMTSGIGAGSPANALSMLEQWFVPHLTYADRRVADFVAARSAALNVSSPSKTQPIA